MPQATLTQPVVELDAILLALGTRPAAGRTEWLRRGLHQAIVRADLPAGGRLPGARTLAEALGVARGTVTAALDRLCDEGLLTAQARSGYVVAHLPAGASRPPRPALARTAPSPGVGDLAAFPRGAWLSAVRHALATLSNDELGYGSALGHRPLRECLAGYLRRTRGAEVDPANLLVVNGVSQALSLLAAVSLDRHLGTWFVEDPQSPEQRGHLARNRVRIEPLAVDGQGLIPDGIDRPSMVLVTPARQAPTGVRLSPERRRALLRVATGAGATIVEDDFDGDLPLARDRVSVLQGIAPDRVVLVGSVSKALAPGLRLGWIVAPTGWREDLVRARLTGDLSTPVIDQAAFAHFIDSGAYDRHLGRVRRRYAARRASLIAALDRHGLTPMDTSQTGLSVCLRLDAHHAHQAQARLRVLGVPARVTPAAGHDPGVGYLSVGTATLTPDSVHAAAEAIAAAGREP
ncbi:MAG: PLP-dependent aminotransferase family protein [Actinomycetales bacterium]